MKPIAATRIFDELPPMDEVLARKVTVLGSTGSIGVNTLDVIARHPDRYRVVALSAHTQTERLLSQCVRFVPRYAVVADEAHAADLRRALNAAKVSTEVLVGPDGLATVASVVESDIVMAAIVGAAGLLPTLAAIRAGKRVLLANKEPLVMAGDLCLQEARRTGAQLLPIDSEHNAIFQCLPANYADGLEQVGVRKILLTCSGGPFRTAPTAALANVTPEQACAHPNWSMGRKISVDSATLMNKGLEVIEACRLFGATPAQVEVVIHPQSIVHSLVEYEDGSMLAQLGNPDMRTPIAHALAWPERIASGVQGLDLFTVARLDFAPPDAARFPCLQLAYDAARAGGTAPTVLNAANEIAVAAFLAGEIGFLNIADTIAHTLNTVATDMNPALETILAHDARARTVAADYVSAHPRV